MSRSPLLALAALVAAVALAVAGSASAAPVKVVGKVGPGYTISLTIGGKKVKKLEAGVSYRFVITDRSEDHDFHLMGPGVMKTITNEEFTGTKSVVLKLRKGTYQFLCNPHSDQMRGRFSST